jgi:hypothetical protein
MRSIASQHVARAFLGALSLAACTSNLAGEPGLMDDVKRYYDQHAIEVAGRCRAPHLGTVISSDVLERSPERLVIRIRYSYSQPNAQYQGECDGFGERTFTITGQPGKFDVVEMSGTQLKGIRIQRIDNSKVW